MSGVSMRPIGVILAGGRSSRMGTDKAFIPYHGVPQVDWLHNLLQPWCKEVYTVFRRLPEDYRHPFLIDNPVWGDIGPMAGVLTAHDAFAEESLLVIGCDYPFLSPETIRLLFEQRTPGSGATALINPDDLRPEPLLAIYEPEALSKLKEEWESGRHSLRAFLESLKVMTIKAADDRQTRSVDTPDEARGVLKTQGNQ